jgi:hypothetical protein
MFQRAAKLKSRPVTARSASETAAHAPPAPLLTAAALPRDGFASLAVHPPIAQLKNGKGSKNQAKKAKKASAKVKEASAVTAQDRLATYGANWEKRDWREHTKALGLKGFKTSDRTESGKTIFKNPQDHEIVVDHNAGYWRHLDGNGNYLDKDGNANAANEETHFLHK